MANIHAVYLKASQISDLANPVLVRRFSKYGFQTAEVKEEEDFDGESIIRIIANVESRVPARELISASGELQTLLREHDEARFVYLSTERPGDDDDEEDVL